MTWARAIVYGLTFLGSFLSHARENDPPLTVPPGLRVAGTCEGFFTLGRPSALVIGAEERLDHLIANGHLPDQNSVDAFDQALYAAARARRAEVFARSPRFDGSVAVPPGLRLRLGRQTLFTADPDEQHVVFADVIRNVGLGIMTSLWLTVDDAGHWSTHAEDPRPGGDGRWREVFHVRRANSLAPGAEDFGRLRGATGVSVVRAADAYTLVVYE